MPGTFGSYVVIHPKQLADFLRSPTGPVTRHMIKDGERVKQQAIIECPVAAEGAPAGPGVSRYRQPGTMKRSIVKRVVMKSTGVTVIVGSDDPAALWVHEGTIPHRIVPRRKKWLVFYWRGRWVFSKGVNHPGTRPNRFLLRALRVLR